MIKYVLRLQGNTDFVPCEAQLLYIFMFLVSAAYDMILLMEVGDETKIFGKLVKM